jgi:hypothetical protein
MIEHPTVQRDTQAWIFQTWASFLIAVSATGLGILYLPVDGWIRGFLAMGLLFTIGSCFTLSKTIRDNHEAGRLLNRISDAKTERILREFEMKTEAEPAR